MGLQYGAFTEQQRSGSAKLAARELLDDFVLISIWVVQILNVPVPRLLATLASNCIGHENK